MDHSAQFHQLSYLAQRDQMKDRNNEMDEEVTVYSKLTNIHINKQETHAGKQRRGKVNTNL